MGVGERGACTLLGPEGPDVACSSFGWGVVADSLGFLGCRLLLVVGECRPYFENYTVDASIFEMALRGCLV